VGVSRLSPQAPIPTLEIPEIRPRKPSAKISKIWKCGHDVSIDWVIDGFRYCPYCGSKYPKNKINLIARWIAYQKWHIAYHRFAVPPSELMKDE